MNGKETLVDKIFKLINIAGTAVLINLLFLVSCLPVVTIGQAWCGLLGAIRYNIRGDSWWEGYKKGFKTRFLRGTVVWCVLLVGHVYFFLDLSYAVSEAFMTAGGVNAAYIAAVVAAGLMYALVNMLTVSFVILNVYIPTKVSDWLRNGVGMVFKVPLHLLCAAVLFCFPLVFGWFWAELFGLVAVIFVGFYYTLAALAITMIMKNPLIDYLLDARVNGTLIAEEGKQTVYGDEEDEEIEEEDRSENA